MASLFFFFFFFQAEDGIRDHCVTGVQTCALPICSRGRQMASMSKCLAQSNKSRRASKATKKRHQQRSVSPQSEGEAAREGCLQIHESRSETGDRKSVV